MLYAPVPLAFARLKVAVMLNSPTVPLYAKIKLNSKLHISRVGAAFVVMRSLRPYTVLAYGCAPQSAKIATVGVYISVFSSTVTHCV